MVKKLIFVPSFAALILGGLLLAPLFALCLWAGNYEETTNEND